MVRRVRQRVLQMERRTPARGAAGLGLGLGSASWSSEAHCEGEGLLCCHERRVKGGVDMRGCARGM